MKKWEVLTGLMLINGMLFAQKTGVIDNAGVGIKVFNANQAFYSGEVDKALKLYDEANTAKPNDGSILYHIGQCHYVRQEMEDALTYLEKAEYVDSNANEDLHLTLGIVYLQEDEISKAKAEFMWHKRKYSNNPKKLSDDQIVHYIAECDLAKLLEAKPVDVKIKNAGDGINSEYNEKSPSVTADGTTLIFTSDRPLLVGDMKAPKDPSKDPLQPFDNVYLCKWDSSKGDWGLSFPITGDVNEAYAHTSCTSISPDGNYIFLYKNSAHGPSLGGDIYVSKRAKKGSWGAPVSIGKPVNTSYYEDGACISPDGNSLFFISERPGGYGRADIYKAEKVSKSEWGKPENLGPVVNSEYDEGSPFIAPDGHTLFFSSDGHSSMGGYDIFKTVINDSTGKWSTPANLGYPINTVSNEKSFSISGDARTGYFSSDRKGGTGKRDIYIADLSNYSVLSTDKTNSKPKGFSILRGKITNPKGEPAEEAQITVMDSSNTKVATMRSNSEGMYFITLKANAKYKIKVSLKGCKPTSKPIRLPESTLGTFTMEQDFVMEKE